MASTEIEFTRAAEQKQHNRTRTIDGWMDGYSTVKQANLILIKNIEDLDLIAHVI